MAAEEGDVTPQALSGLLSHAGAGVIPPSVIATWTTRERERAAAWATAVRRHASGDSDADGARRPACVLEAADLAENPAVAQLAVEAWTRLLEELEGSQRRIGPVLSITLDTARRAITGLLVLTEAGTGQFAWQRKAAGVMRAHPAGLSTADLMGLLGTGGPDREALEAWLDAGEAGGLFERAGYSAWRLRGTRL